jgi:cytochrome c oxidase subunit 3
MRASDAVQGKEAPYYYVPADSGHPVRLAFALLLTVLGLTGWINGLAAGKWGVLVGLVGVLIVLYFWFGDAIKESESGLYSKRIDVSYRWGMSWFIFSEVMFFAGFFGALWYVRAVTTPWLGDAPYGLTSAQPA